MSDNVAIKFWRTSDEFGCLSNFSADPIELDGYKWMTTEHYFQAMKHADPKKQAKIRNADSPKEAKNLAYQLGDPRPEWDKIKIQVMKRTLWAKVTQNARVKEALLKTGNAPIVEDSPYDYIWGAGRDGSGKNLLGKLWMEIRNELKGNI